MTYFSSTQDFFESNSLVAKVAFLNVSLNYIYIFITNRYKYNRLVIIPLW